MAENNCGDCLCKKCKHKNTNDCPNISIGIGMCSECSQIYVTARCPDWEGNDGKRPIWITGESEIVGDE